MTDWLKEMDAAPSVPKKTVDWWAEMSPPAEEVRAQSENIGGGVVDDPDLAAPNLVIARASLAPDVDDQIKRYADHFGVPTSQFGVIDGEVVRWVPEKRVLAKVVPTIGGGHGVGGKFQGFAGQTASGVGPALPQAAGMVAGTIAGPTATSIPAAAGAAGLTDWARQALDRFLADEPMMNVDVGNIAGHAAMAGLGQGIGVGVSKMLTRNPLGIQRYDRAIARDPVLQTQWDALEAEANRRGIKLSLGQKTGMRSILVKERQAARWPETTDRIYRFRDAQWKKQIPEAYRNEVASIAPDRGREAMISSFREGADDVVEGVLSARSKAAEAAYGQAYEAHQSLMSPKLKSILANRGKYIDEALTAARTSAQSRGQLMGAVDEELTEAARFARDIGKMDKVPRAGVAKGFSLNTWDRIKRALDRLPGQVDEHGKLTQKGSDVRAILKDLRPELDRLTGGKDSPYRAARAQYGESSEVVDQVLKGGVGFIKKMRGLDRTNMVTHVFQGRNILPEEIARTRKLFIKAGKLGDWNSGLAAHLSQVLDDSIKSAGRTGNVPGQIYSRLGADKLQHDAVAAAMGKAKAEGFEKFLEVLDAAAQSLPEGSPTATDLVSRAGQLGPVARGVGKILSPQSYLEAGETVVKGIEAIREPIARIRLAEYLLTPKGTQELAKLKIMSRTSEKATLAAAHIMMNAGLTATGVRRPDDFPVPDMPIGP